MIQLYYRDSCILLMQIFGGAAIGMYQIFADDKELKELEEYIDKIDKLCYGEEPVEYSYFEMCVS